MMGGGAGLGESRGGGRGRGARRPRGQGSGSRSAGAAARRQRAVAEGLQVRLLERSGPVALAEVSGSSSGAIHPVQLRRLAGAGHRCDCWDFHRRGLGTCKHIEAALLAAEAEGWFRGEAPDSLRALLHLDPETADVVYFDLETQRLFQEVGGRSRLDRLGLSVGVTYSRRRGFEVFLEDQAAALVERLLAADLVVGFNLLRFDYEVLAGAHSGGWRVFAAPTLDLLVEVEKAAGFRVSLDRLAARTLGACKMGNGLDAVRWYREGRIENVIEYCKADVEITRRLFEWGGERGVLLAEDRSGALVEIPARWAARPPRASVAAGGIA